tara:strand:+ start:177 stop:548 length:372 start_codon:yes stop_codon:yes gene_type:complete
MIYTISEALLVWKPNSEYFLNGTTYSGLEWKSSDTKPTESEVTAKIKELNDGESMRLLRVERDRLLTACDWTQSRDLILSNDDAWKTYRQALRDLPASASPTLDSDGNLNMSSVTWPNKPSNK